jgi:hypothetical protein
MKKVLGFALFLALASAAPAFAGTTTCHTGDVLPAVISANLDVPAGETCRLEWREVTGNVTVEGTLLSFSTKFDKNVTVTGGIINIMNGWGATTPLVGNLTITGSAGNSSIGCANTTNVIYGNLTYTGNTGNLYVCQATVSGAVNVSYNQRINLDYSGPYSAALYGITAGKPISCIGNTLVQGGGLIASQVTGDCAPFKQ